MEPLHKGGAPHPVHLTNPVGAILAVDLDLHQQEVVVAAIPQLAPKITHVMAVTQAIVKPSAKPIIPTAPQAPGGLVCTNVLLHLHRHLEHPPTPPRQQ